VVRAARDESELTYVDFDTGHYDGDTYLDILEPPESSIAAIDWVTSAGAVPTVCVFRPLTGTDLADAEPLRGVLSIFSRKLASPLQHQGEQQRGPSAPSRLKIFRLRRLSAAEEIEMSQKAIRRTITAAFFAATLALTGTSEAGGLFTTTPASETRIEQNLWAQAWDWMASLWGDLVGVSSDKSTGDTSAGTPTGSSSTTTSTTSSCTNPAGCEAGWGIDPNG
jgi:hypothetical protein